MTEPTESTTPPQAAPDAIEWMGRKYVVAPDPAPASATPTATAAQPAQAAPVADVGDARRAARQRSGAIRRQWAANPWWVRWPTTALVSGTGAFLAWVIVVGPALDRRAEAASRSVINRIDTSGLVADAFAPRVRLADGTEADKCEIGQVAGCTASVATELVTGIARAVQASAPATYTVTDPLAALTPAGCKLSPAAEVAIGADPKTQGKTLHPERSATVAAAIRSIQGSYDSRGLRIVVQPDGALSVDNVSTGAALLWTCGG